MLMLGADQVVALGPRMLRRAGLGGISTSLVGRRRWITPCLFTLFCNYINIRRQNNLPRHLQAPVFPRLLFCLSGLHCSHFHLLLSPTHPLGSPGARRPTKALRDAVGTDSSSWTTHKPQFCHGGSRCAGEASLDMEVPISSTQNREPHVPLGQGCKPN